MFAAPAQAADVKRLLDTLSLWEDFEYVATAVVFFGVLGEFLTEFTNTLKTEGNDARKQKFNRAFTLVLLVGLAGELTSLVKTSRITGHIIDALTSNIAVAYTSAGEANVHAQEAKAQEARLQLDNTTLKRDLQKATQKSKIEEEKLRKANLATETKLEEDHKASLELENKLEAERITRLGLEAALAPRAIPLIFYSAGKGANFSPLTPYSGITVVFEVLNDAEGRRAAGNLWSILENAGWKPSLAPARADIESGFYDGVTILGPVAEKAPDPSDPMVPELASACFALEKFLTSNGWKAKCLHVFSPKYAPNPFKELRVVVGFKEALEDFEQKKQWEELQKRIHGAPTPPTN